MIGLASTIPTLLMNVPFFLTMLVGIILCIVFWKRHPKVSLLALIAFIILIVDSLVGMALTAWITMTAASGKMDGQQFGIVSVTVNCFQSLLTVAAWVMLLFSIFGWRKAQTPVVEIPAEMK
jgi:hypothetical protein